MTKRSAVALSALVLSMAAPVAVIAQTAPAPVPAAAAPKKAALDSRIDPNAIVCKGEDTTGSRLGAKKVCLTRQQWTDMATSSRERLQESQSLSRTH